MLEGYKLWDGIFGVFLIRIIVLVCVEMWIKEEIIDIVIVIFNVSEKKRVC